jgi:predicted nuclease with TOPRIM domain
MADEIEPTTDRDKIAWLWRRRDEDNQRLADAHSRIKVLEGDKTRLTQEGRKLRGENAQLREEIARLGVEVNQARAAAATAVREALEERGLT